MLSGTVRAGILIELQPLNSQMRVVTRCSIPVLMQGPTKRSLKLKRRAVAIAAHFSPTQP